MTSYTLAHKVTLNVWECPACGVIYGITEEFARMKQAAGESYVCPNGHRLSWKDSEADVLRRHLASANQDAEWYKARHAEAEGSLRATRGVVTKLKKKVQAGVCPVDDCRRNFVNVGSHVRRMHPDWHPDR